MREREREKSITQLMMGKRRVESSVVAVMVGRYSDEEATRTYENQLGGGGRSCSKSEGDGDRSEQPTLKHECSARHGVSQHNNVLI